MQQKSSALAAITFVAACAKRILTFATAFFFFGLTLVPAVQIALRLVGRPFIGAEELTQFFLICMIFLSFPLVVAAKENIVMGEFKSSLPTVLRKAVEIFIDFCAIAITFYVAYASYNTILKNLKNATPTLQIPFWIFLSSTFVSFLCAGFLHIWDLLQRIFPNKLGAAASGAKNVTQV